MRQGRRAAAHPASASPNSDCIRSAGGYLLQRTHHPATPKLVCAGPPKDRRSPSVWAYVFRTSISIVALFMQWTIVYPNGTREVVLRKDFSGISDQLLISDQSEATATARSRALITRFSKWVLGL